jgi:hypothetical protein
MILRETVKNHVEQYVEYIFREQPTVRDFCRSSINMKKVVDDIHVACNQVDFAFVARGKILSSDQMNRFMEDMVCSLLDKILENVLHKSDVNI